MINNSACEWLAANADSPIRYRIYREIFKNEAAAKVMEAELFDNTEVKRWLQNLSSAASPQNRSLEHGSVDFCLENALLKIVQLGLHGGIPQVASAVRHFEFAFDDAFQNSGDFTSILTANLLTLAGIPNKSARDYMDSRLDVLYNFVCKRDYNIYISDAEKSGLKAVPAIWKNKSFIKKSLIDDSGFCFPFVYDIAGMHKLYGSSAETDAKINAVIEYISTDEFHRTVPDNYGILISGEKKYHTMGWDPKYPGWFDAASYMEGKNARKLLFFALFISRYPPARKTKWFGDLFCCLDKYKTGNGTYIFPADWLTEQTGYAVLGHHMSFGENRRKKNWREIESTFYIQLLNCDTNVV